MNLANLPQRTISGGGEQNPKMIKFQLQLNWVANDTLSKSTKEQSQNDRKYSYNYLEKRHKST